VAVNDGRLPVNCYWNSAGLGAGWSVAEYQTEPETMGASALEVLAPEGGSYREVLPPHCGRILVAAPDSVLDVAGARRRESLPAPGEGWRALPNPFRAITEIRFSADHAGPARAEIFDFLGRRVAQASWRLTAPGPQAWVWNGRDGRGASTPSGVYFCRITSGPESRVIRLLRFR
jgi:hypothetical protein